MRLVLAILLSLLAGAAQARQPAPDTAAIRAEGERLLAASGAQEFFLNETGQRPGVILLRHRPSGYLCMLNPGRAENRVTVYPHPRPGHNVSCTTSTVGGTQTRYFTHEADPQVTEQVALDVAVAGIRQRFPDARPAAAPALREGQLTLVPPEGSPRPRVAVFSRAEGDERVDVGKRGDWLVKLRFSAPAGLGRLGGPLDAFWLTTVLERDRWRTQAASPAAPTQPQAPPALKPVPARSPEEQRAEALRLIEASGAAGKFEPVEQEGRVMYRHRASGLTCSFQPGAGKLNVGADPAGGEIATCFSLDSTARHSTVLGVQRNRRGVNADQALQAVVQGMRRRDRSLRPASGPGLSASVGPGPGRKPLPPHRSATLEGLEGGQPAYVRVTAAVVGDWILTDISRAPGGDRMQADLLGELGFIATLDRMVEAQQGASAR